MENLAQAFSVLATLAFLAGSTAGFLCLRADRAPDPASASGMGNTSSTARLSIAWRIFTLVGIFALIGSIVVRSSTASASGLLAAKCAGDRATIVALVAGLLGLGQNWQSLVRSGRCPSAWGVWLLMAAVTGVSILNWPSSDIMAPVLLGCTLLSAGLGLWSIGHCLDVLASGQTADPRPFLLAFAWLTATIVLAGAVNGWGWGSPTGAAMGDPSAWNTFVSMLAVWLVGAAYLVLRRRAVRLSFGVGLAYAAVLVGVALSIQWRLPFN